MDSIYGIVPPVVTPFREDDSLDEGAFRAEIQYMIETAKVHGLAVTGSTGEGHTLGDDEVRQLTQWAVEEADGRVPVITGIITDSTKSAIERGKVVADLGPVALQVTPVHYLFRPDDDAMVRHFEALCEGTGLPVMIYNVVPWTYLLTRIIDEVDGVVGVKQSAGDVNDHRRRRWLVAVTPVGQFATLGLLTQSLCSDIPSSVAVGMVFMTTRFAQEGCLGTPIVFLTVSAFSTRLAGVFGIHRDHGNTSTLCLIFDKGAQLEERPPRHFSTLRLAKPFLALAYACLPVCVQVFRTGRRAYTHRQAFEVFKSNRFASVFGLLNNAFRDDMVGISTKPALPAGDNRKFSANILGSLALLDKIGRLLLERLLQLVHLLADVFSCLTGKSLAIVGDSEIDSTEIDANKVGGRYWRAIWNIY